VIGEALLREALSDAVSYRDPPLYCPACAAMRCGDAGCLACDGLCCEGCAAGLARARSYLALGEALGAEGTR
jgi:hypothetical protein